MIVRATQDLAPDTEITFRYKSPIGESYAGRQKEFRHWEFKCDCPICQDIQTTKKSISAERSELRAKALNYHDPYRGITDIAKFQTIIEKAMNTYSRPAPEVPRLNLWDPLLGLAMAYMKKGQLFKAINSTLKALESLGYIIDGGDMPRASDKQIVVRKWGLMVNSLVNCWMLLSKAYELVAPELKDTALQYARISYKICVGEDETFDETYKVVKL